MLHLLLILTYYLKGRLTGRGKRRTFHPLLYSPDGCTKSLGLRVGSPSPGTAAAFHGFPRCVHGELGWDTHPYGMSG